MTWSMKPFLMRYIVEPRGGSGGAAVMAIAGVARATRTAAVIRSLRMLTACVWMQASYAVRWRWLTIMPLLTFAAPTAFAYAACVTVKYRDKPVCLDTFVCTETPQSSFVRQICYDAAKSYMLIKLNDTWYHYCTVDRTSVENLVHASSVGTYYNQHFRSQRLVHGPFDCRDHPIPNYP